MKQNANGAGESPRIGAQTRVWDPAIAGRAALAIALAVMLIVALRWALNVTNANARQVSSNLSHLQDRFERTPSESFPSRAARPSPDPKQEKARKEAPGPSLEPVDGPR